MTNEVAHLKTICCDAEFKRVNKLEYKCCQCGKDVSYEVILACIFILDKE